MNKKLPADDLFEQSSMSFGEHLEELRKSLMKAFIWLGGGTIVGLMFANQIVLFIERPLTSAIRQFHIAQAQQQYELANGEKPSEELAAWMTTEGMMPERVFINPQGLVPERNGLQAESTTAASPSNEPQAAAAEVQAAEAPATPGSENPKDKAESADAADDATGQAPPESTKSDASAGDDPSKDSAAVRLAPMSQTEPALAAPIENPWTGISLQELRRLKPLLLWRPIPSKLISLNPVEGFMIWLKAGLVAGVIIGSPGIFWHIWQFLAAGLYPHERRYVYWYLPLSLVLFLAGVSLAFFVVFELVLGFLMNYSTGLNVEFTPRLNDYMSFALFLPLGFGLAFQLPIVMVGLHRFGIVSVSSFVAQWRIAVLVIAFLSMLLSPPDIYSMMGLFIPLVLLYFFGIFLCKYMPKGAGVGGPAVDPQG
ncbi:MAG: twin-arginine translocase subunit TatC [bacterium]|nr:twin-arginine translocase subunit TatC [bacterium]